ncbi:MAG: aldo/keto reductase [Acutalibacter sp.]|nr:aldo/keto reductase [Acutalibacter sp.]
MQYRKDKKGREISRLGYGCMRFTKKGGAVDLDKAEKELAAAIQGGINYFDTAYTYPGNEAALGQLLGRLGCREQVYIATKLPHYLVKSVAGAEKIFQEELRSLGTDYIDFYLIHMLTDTATWQRLLDMGLGSWLQEKLAAGQIRSLGFSYHGGSAMFCRLVEAYDWDFCQIQYNYMDEHSQAGAEGLRFAHARGLPVIVMEPLRGGRLVDLLPQAAKEVFRQDSQGRTPAQLAFQWLYNQEEVTCVLSGMHSLDMVEENLRLADQCAPGCMGPSDWALLERVKEEISRYVQVGCTGCGYCMPCPQGVDIPGAFRCYNAMYAEGKSSGRRDYLQCTAMRREPSSASQCVACGKCAARCPQGIDIPAQLGAAAKALETLPYRAIRWAVGRFGLW